MIDSEGLLKKFEFIKDYCVSNYLGQLIYANGFSRLISHYFNLEEMDEIGWLLNYLEKYGIVITEKIECADQTERIKERISFAVLERAKNTVYFNSTLPYMKEAYSQIHNKINKND